MEMASDHIYVKGDVFCQSVLWIAEEMRSGPGVRPSGGNDFVRAETLGPSPKFPR